MPETISTAELKRPAFLIIYLFSRGLSQKNYDNKEKRKRKCYNLEKRMPNLSFIQYPISTINCSLVGNNDVMVVATKLKRIDVLEIIVVRTKTSSYTRKKKL